MVRKFALIQPPGSTYDCGGATPVLWCYSHHAAVLFPHEWRGPISESRRVGEIRQPEIEKMVFYLPGPTEAKFELMMKAIPVRVRSQLFEKD